VYNYVIGVFLSRKGCLCCDCHIFHGKGYMDQMFLFMMPVHRFHTLSPNIHFSILVLLLFLSLDTDVVSIEANDFSFCHQLIVNISFIQLQLLGFYGKSHPNLMRYFYGSTKYFNSRSDPSYELLSDKTLLTLSILVLKDWLML
jgi:hypothetical protein